MGRENKGETERHRETGVQIETERGRGTQGCRVW